MDGYVLINSRVLSNDIWKRTKSTKFSVYGSAKVTRITHQYPSIWILKQGIKLDYQLTLMGKTGKWALKLPACGGTGAVECGVAFMCGWSVF